MKTIVFKGILANEEKTRNEILNIIKYNHTINSHGLIDECNSYKLFIKTSSTLNNNILKNISKDFNIDLTIQ